MTIHKTLEHIQQNLNAPKDRKNSFGNYNYRSCEDILEAIKPLLKETDSKLVISDEIINIGDRYYVKSTATLSCEDGLIFNTAFARESEEKKGMDSAQITGATSSYARKYALNGLFLIDDTKDADTDEYTKTTEKPQETQKNTDKDTSKPKTMEQLCKVLTYEQYNTLNGNQKLKIQSYISETQKLGSPFCSDEDVKAFLTK
jgi:hypothetical protein